MATQLNRTRNHSYAFKMYHHGNKDGLLQLEDAIRELLSKWVCTVEQLTIENHFLPGPRDKKKQQKIVFICAPFPSWIVI